MADRRYLYLVESNLPLALDIEGDRHATLTVNPWGQRIGTDFTVVDQIHTVRGPNRIVAVELRRNPQAKLTAVTTALRTALLDGLEDVTQDFADGYFTALEQIQKVLDDPA